MASRKPDAQALEKARASQKAYIERSRQVNKGPQFDLDVMSRLQILEASSSGYLMGEIELGHEYGNLGGALHGAAYPVLFGGFLLEISSDRFGSETDREIDMFTSLAFAPTMPLAMATPENFDLGPPGGPSRAMNVTYLRPLPLPIKARIECDVVQDGKTVALARATLMSVDGKKAYAICEHHKMKDPRLADRIAKVSKL